MPEINWTESMGQTFEFYEVDPKTWFDVRPINNIKSATITRDLEYETLQSASIDADNLEGEMYIRIYLRATQGGFRFREPLGTFMMQTPSMSFDGKIKSSSIDAYSPLVELKEKNPPIGFSLLKGQEIMSNAAQLTSDNLRAPVIKDIPNNKVVEYESGFVANTDDTWLKYLTELINNADYSFDIDPMGVIFFSPYQNVAKMQPVMDFNDDNSSILYPEISVNRDIYGIPNVVEVVHSTKDDFYIARCVNDNPNSPISTVNRGREIVRREMTPDTLAMGTHSQLDAYAEQLLSTLSTLEYKLSYTHGYYPIRLNDCVRLNYEKAGITDVKAKVIKQTITCTPGCSVKEEAVFPSNLWR